MNISIMTTKNTELLAILESNRSATDKVLLLNALKENETIKCYICKSLMGRRFLVSSQCSWWKRLFCCKRTEVFQIKTDPSSGTARLDPISSCLSEETFSNGVQLIKIDDKLTYRLTFLRQDPATRDFEAPRDYLVVSKHGQGGFANVYKVYNMRKQCLRAIKKIKPDRLRDSNKDEHSSLEGEFDILKSLKHVNIINVYNYYDRPSCFEMDFCHGRSLYDHLKNGHEVSETNSKVIFKQVFSALSYLHENQGITHRDVKTENILFLGEHQNVVKLVDFGLATRKVREIYESCGTDLYLAPEVAIKYLQNDVKAYECSVDVWSAGVCLFETISGGRLPFGSNLHVKELSRLQTVPGGELTTYLKDVVDGSSEPNLGILKVMHWHPLHDLLRKTFKKQFFKRPSCSEVLKHDWFKTS